MCNGLERVIEIADRQKGYSHLSDPKQTENTQAGRRYSSDQTNSYNDLLMH